VGDPAGNAPPVGSQTAIFTSWMESGTGSARSGSFVISNSNFFVTIEAFVAQNPLKSISGERHFVPPAIKEANSAVPGRCSFSQVHGCKKLFGVVITLYAFSGKCNVTVCMRPSVRLSVLYFSDLNRARGVTHQGAACDAANIHFGSTEGGPTYLFITF